MQRLSDLFPYLLEEFGLILLLSQIAIQWGKEAMQKGINANRVKDRLVEGFSSNGMKFVGYLDDQEKIKNFYPAF